jgi:hypothetical protein
MAQRVNRDQALAAIDAERAAWDALVAAVGERRLDEPGPMGEWSFKDLAAHLTGWRARTVQRLEAAVRGEPEPSPPWPAEFEDDDEINDWIHQGNRDRPAARVPRAAEVNARRSRTRGTADATPTRVSERSLSEIRHPLSMDDGTGVSETLLSETRRGVLS